MTKYRNLKNYTKVAPKCANCIHFKRDSIHGPDNILRLDLCLHDEDMPVALKVEEGVCDYHRFVNGVYRDE